MFQVFQMDVAKVDRDVAYVAMVVHVCCKCLFLMFHPCFQAYVASVLMLCFTHMSCMFAMVFKHFSGVFSSVSETCFKRFICIQTYVASVAYECFKSRSGVTHGMHTRSGEGAQAVPVHSLTARATTETRDHMAKRNVSANGGMLARTRETECSTGVRTSQT
jgi:hypothetical protein